MTKSAREKIKRTAPARRTKKSKKARKSKKAAKGQTKAAEYTNYLLELHRLQGVLLEHLQKELR